MMMTGLDGLSELEIATHRVPSQLQSGRDIAVRAHPSLRSLTRHLSDLSVSNSVMVDPQNDMDQYIGARKEALDTPVLLVDLDVLEWNILKMSNAIIGEAGVGW